CVGSVSLYWSVARRSDVWLLLPALWLWSFWLWARAGAIPLRAAHGLPGRLDSRPAPAVPHRAVPKYPCTGQWLGILRLDNSGSIPRCGRPPIPETAGHD